MGGANIRTEDFSSGGTTRQTFTTGRIVKTSGSTQVVAIHGNAVQAIGNETSVQMSVIRPCTTTKLKARIASNADAIDRNITLRKGAASQTLAITIIGNLTGIFTDEESISLVEDDLINYMYDGVLGAQTGTISLEVEY